MSLGKKISIIYTYNVGKKSNDEIKEKRVDISFDKRVELLLGLQFCVERDRPNILYPDGNFFCDTLPSYCEAFYELYKKAASEEFVEYIAEGGLDTYNRTIEIAFSLDKFYHIGDTKEIVYIESRNPRFNKSFLQKELCEFVKKADFDGFFDEKKGLLAEAIEAYRVALCSKAEFDEQIFSEFYGYSLGKYKVILYNFAHGGYGMQNKELIVNLQGFRNVGNDEKHIMMKPSSCVITCLHEFSHPYLNPLGEKYFENVDLTAFFKNAIENGLDSCYNNPIVLINEYMVRAVQFYLGKKYLNPKDIESMIEWHKTRLGYCYIEEVMSLFDLRWKYASFEDFYKNEVVDFFIK